MSDDFLVHFRGVRGSIPTPPRPSQIKDKVKKVLELASADDIKDEVSIENFLQSIPFHLHSLMNMK